MIDLVTLKNQQIEKLQAEICEANQRITQLETYIFELCDSNCPKAYKNVIQSEVFKHLNKKN